MGAAVRTMQDGTMKPDEQRGYSIATTRFQRTARADGRVRHVTFRESARSTLKSINTAPLRRMEYAE